MLDIDEIVAKLFKRGYTPEGVSFVLRLLAAENPEGSERRRRLDAEADEFIH
jgi:hypothetical protein